MDSMWQERIVEVTVELLQRWGLDNMRLVELLRAVCALMAHRRYAEAMVAAGGLQLLLDLPKNAHTAGMYPFPASDVKFNITLLMNI